MSRTLVFIILCLLFSSCKETIVQPDSEPEVFFPLKPGNYWKFHAERYDTLGKVVGTWRDSVYLIGDTTIGNEYWVYEEFYGHLKAYRNGHSGLFTRLISTHAPTDQYLMYQYPLDLRSTYGFPLFTLSNLNAWIVTGELSCTPFNTDTTITVLAGTFKCVAYKMTYRTGSFHYEFVAKDYGWVKIDFYGKQSNGSFRKANTIQLVEINIQP